MGAFVLAVVGSSLVVGSGLTFVALHCAPRFRRRLPSRVADYSAKAGVADNTTNQTALDASASCVDLDRTTSCTTTSSRSSIYHVDDLGSALPEMVCIQIGGDAPPTSCALEPKSKVRNWPQAFWSRWRVHSSA